MKNLQAKAVKPTDEVATDSISVANANSVDIIMIFFIKIEVG